LNKEARTVFNTIQALITTNHQLQTFNALIAAFLEADGNPRPEHAPVKSPSAFSRFLNVYDWNARAIIRAVRTAILTQIWAAYAQRKGRRPILEIILDLTTLEKTGVFPNLEIHQLKDKIGLHLVVLYIVIGVHRFPWSLAVWRGKDTVTPAQLALRLLSCLPAWWSERFTVRVLADSGFDSDEFIDGVHHLGLHGVIGARASRVIGPDKRLSDLRCKGSEVQFKSCKTPVFASWFKLKRARKEFVWRYVISTRRADGETIRRLGRRRWRIEAFFKTMKFRFGLDQFGQRTTRGAFRFIVLGLLAFMLAFWEALEAVADWAVLDWGLAARGAADELVPEIQALEAQRTLERLRPILKARGIAC
jgi:Transposase DDE domain